MYAAIREYKVKPGQSERIALQVRGEFAPAMRGIPGFLSYTVTMPSDTEVLSTSLWENEAAAEESDRIGAEMRRRLISDIVEGTPRVTNGRVLLRETNPGTKITYGVMRRFSMKPDQVQPSLQKVREGIVPILKSTPGFGAYAVVDCGNGAVISLAGFENETSARSAADRVIAWSQKALPDITASEVKQGVVLYRESNDSALVSP